jgi:hypothetical protein
LGQKLNCQVKVLGSHQEKNELIYRIVSIQINNGDKKVKEVKNLVVKGEITDKTKIFKDGQEVEIAMELRKVEAENSGFRGIFSFGNKKLEDNISLGRNKKEQFSYHLILLNPTAEEFKLVEKKTPKVSTATSSVSGSRPTSSYGGVDWGAATSSSGSTSSFNPSVQTSSTISTELKKLTD